MMRCNSCESDFRTIEGAKYCPFCGKRLLPFISTEEYDKFLIENCNMHRKDLTEEFNKKFGTNKSVSAIAHRCRRLGLVMPKEIRYELTKNAPKKLPIGSERYHGNCVWVKVSDENAHHAQSRFKSSCWVQKHRYVWEKNNGPIPDGMEIIFLDGNSKNCDLKNLAIATRRERNLSNNPKMFNSECAETKKTAIEWCKLYFAVKDAGYESYVEAEK